MEILLKRTDKWRDVPREIIPMLTVLAALFRYKLTKMSDSVFYEDSGEINFDVKLSP